MTREAAASLLDSLDKDALMRLVSELTWFSVCREGRGVPGEPSNLADLRRLMLEAAREHAIDALTLEPATVPLAGRAG